MSSEKKSFPLKQSKIKLEYDHLNNLKEHKFDTDNLNMDEIGNAVIKDLSDYYICQKLLKCDKLLTTFNPSMQFDNNGNNDGLELEENTSIKIKQDISRSPQKVNMTYYSLNNSNGKGVNNNSSNRNLRTNTPKFLDSSEFSNE